MDPSLHQDSPEKEFHNFWKQFLIESKTKQRKFGNLSQFWPNSIQLSEKLILSQTNAKKLMLSQHCRHKYWTFQPAWLGLLTPALTESQQGSAQKKTLEHNTRFRVTHFSKTLVPRTFLSVVAANNRVEWLKKYFSDRAPVNCKNFPKTWNHQHCRAPALNRWR